MKEKMEKIETISKLLEPINEQRELILSTLRHLKRILVYFKDFLNLETKKEIEKEIQQNEQRLQTLEKERSLLLEELRRLRTFEN